MNSLFKIHYGDKLPLNDQISAEEKELKKLRESLLKKEREVGLLKEEKLRKEREQQKKAEMMEEKERIKKLGSSEQRLYFYRDLVEKEKTKFETFKKHGKILKTENVGRSVAITKLLVIIDSLHAKYQWEFKELRKEIEKLKKKEKG